LDYQDNKAYQLAALEQQNRVHDTLNELNRSLLTDREKRHADVEGLSLQVDGLREDLNRLFTDSFRGAQRSELTLCSSGMCPSHHRTPNLHSKERRGWEDGLPADLEGCKPLDRGADRPAIWMILRLQAKICLRATSTRIVIATQNPPYQFEVATPQLPHIREYQASPPGRLWDSHGHQPFLAIFAPSRDSSQVKGLQG